ncbi:MAG: hypothetical protein KDA50_02385 [Rhodobacteraceae bacterium]|nr:hypothetical protein [Paracoccaceae bacterium]
MVENPAEPGPEPANLRFLRVLVTILTGVMILGLVTIIGLMFWRFSASTPALQLPDTVALPAGATAQAITFGADWYAVVTADDDILIFDRATGDLRQRVPIHQKPE